MSHWILMADGSEYHLTGADAAHNDFNPDTLAHHLAQINRYTGATTRPYSVAEHSLLCAEIAEYMGLPTVVQLACLVHDYHEAITGDASSPAKWTVGHAWEHFEQPIARALRRHLGLHSTFMAWGARIKAIDLVALATERRDLMAFDADRNRPWPVIDTPGCVVEPVEWRWLDSQKRAQMHWTEWRDALAERFNTLAERAKTDHAASIRGSIA